VWLERGCFFWWLAKERRDNSVTVGGQCGLAWFMMMGTGLGCWCCWSGTSAGG